MLDDASYDAFWRISDVTGIRPEYLIPVLFSESGLRPEIRNALGYSGLNQISQAWLIAHRIDPADYLTWVASRQLLEVVLPYMQAQIGWVGNQLHSGARAYQANFYPASLRHVNKTLDDVIVASPSAAYAANKGLDVGSKGSITVRDLAIFVARAAKAAPVKAALQRTYALRPTEMMQDPALGTDFPGGTLTPPAPTPQPQPQPPPLKTTPSSSSGLGVALLGGAIVVGGAYAVSRLTKKHAAARAHENPIHRCPSGTHVQTLIFKRSSFTPASARSWARSHGFRATKVDLKPNTIRIRQKDPSHFAILRTIHFGRGVEAVVGC